MTLKEGQWELGDFVFGKHSRVPVENVEVGAYGHQVGDMQMSQTDEVRFGRDFLQPGLLTFTMGILNNGVLPNLAAIDIKAGHSLPPQIEDMFQAQPMLETLCTEWRADDIRTLFGYTKILRYCKFGIQKRVYGRPRKMSVNVFNSRNEFVPVVAEFQRVDTFSYSDEEFSATGAPSAAGTTPIAVTRAGGGAPTWFRALITGPINDPVIKVGSQYNIELDYNLAAGKVIEITAYPWERRIIDSDGFNLAPKLIGSSPYMEKMKLNPNTTTNVGLSGSATTGATAIAVLWREAYNTL